MSKSEIMEKYWVDFLVWYKDYKDALVQSTNNCVRIPASIDDLFWYWLVRIEPEKGNTAMFLHELRAPASQKER